MVLAWSEPNLEFPLADYKEYEAKRVKTADVAPVTEAAAVTHGQAEGPADLGLAAEDRLVEPSGKSNDHK